VLGNTYIFVPLYWPEFRWLLHSISFCDDRFLWGGGVFGGVGWLGGV